jgi:3-oxoacyl-[acyl-carrier protein] reductase
MAPLEGAPPTPPQSPPESPPDAGTGAGRLALVTGGTGAVGGEVLRALAARGVRAAFTFHQSEARAAELARSLGHRALRCDLRDAAALRSALQSLAAEGASPTVFIHCAAISRNARLSELTDDDWNDTHAVNCRAAFIVCQELAAGMKRAGAGDVVLVGALDRAQSLPVPVQFAATQGMLATMAMSLAKELGPFARVNMIALGVLDAGLSRHLDPKLIADYKTFSALRRVGTPAEAARVIAYLALDNRYMSGKVLPVNGGI